MLACAMAIVIFDNIIISIITEDSLGLLFIRPMNLFKNDIICKN